MMTQLRTFLARKGTETRQQACLLTWLISGVPMNGTDPICCDSTLETTLFSSRLEILSKMFLLTVTIARYTSKMTDGKIQLPILGDIISYSQKFDQVTLR